MTRPIAGWFLRDEENLGGVRKELLRMEPQHWMSTVLGWCEAWWRYTTRCLHTSSEFGIIGIREINLHAHLTPANNFESNTTGDNVNRRGRGKNKFAARRARFCVRYGRRQSSPDPPHRTAKLPVPPLRALAGSLVLTPNTRGVWECADGANIRPNPCPEKPLRGNVVRKRSVSHDMT